MNCIAVSVVVASSRSRSLLMMISIPGMIFGFKAFGWEARAMNNHALGRNVATIRRELGFIFRHARSERRFVHYAFRPGFQSGFAVVPCGS